MDSGPVITNKLMDGTTGSDMTQHGLKHPELMRRFKCNQCVARKKQQSAAQHSDARLRQSKMKLQLSLILPAEPLLKSLSELKNAFDGPPVCPKPNTLADTPSSSDPRIRKPDERLQFP